MSGRSRSRMRTPAANTNSDSAALYTDGTSIPTIAGTLPMPWVPGRASAAFSDEKQMPSRPWPSSERSLSLAVTTATFAPRAPNAASIVPARRYRGSFIMTSASASRSQK